jgi:hypothetical protein
MAKTEFINKLSRTACKVGFKLKKHSPEILAVAGTIGVVAGTVMACKATTKVDAILTETKKHVTEVQGVLENPELQKKYVEKYGEEFTPEDCKKEITVVYTKTGMELAKLYAPAAAVIGLSLAAMLKSNGILRNRYLATSAAYATISQGFKDYRGRVVDRFGEELDKELRYNLKAKEIETKIIDENGDETTVKEVVNVMDDPARIMASTYARFFDEYCAGWDKCAEYNLVFLKQQEQWANDKLKAQGYLYLNEVYEALGIPKTKQGQIVGWVYDEVHPVGDNYVDFGLTDIYNEGVRDFVNGRESRILLDFNVDGIILDLMQ